MSKKNVCRPMFVFDYTNRTIVGSKTNITKAGKPGSKEQTALLKLMRKEPTFTVVAKEIEVRADKRVYDGLDFPFMEEYISIQADAALLIEEYEAVKQMAVDANRSKYPLTKKWFLKKFAAEGVPFDMAAAREAIDRYYMTQAKKSA